jgi:uncharacterized SAM-binding protein YcdF (DUF218 family)
MRTFINMQSAFFSFKHILCYLLPDTMEIIKRSIEILFSPLGIVSLLMIAGIVLWNTKRYSRLARRLLYWGGLLFLIFLFSPLSKYLMLGLEKPFPPLFIPPESPKTERIVILAGYAEVFPGIPVTSMLSRQTLYSLSEGLRLYRLLPGSKIILSGGTLREGEPPIAASMSDFLRQLGVPAEDLITEGNSRNTYENLVEVRKILGSDPFILVASACDLKRAVGVAHRLKMKPVPAPAWIWALQHYPGEMRFFDWVVDFFTWFARPSTDNLFRLQWACHEYAGYVWYRLLGRI